MTTFAGEQLEGVTALTGVVPFEDFYLGNAGVAYTPVLGQRGFIKTSDIGANDGVNFMVHRLHTPLAIEEAVAAV